MNVPFVLAALLIGLAPDYAHAYLDPGSVSVALQALVAAIAGGLMTLRIYWRQIMTFLRRVFRRDTPKT